LGEDLSATRQQHYIGLNRRFAERIGVRRDVAAISAAGRGISWLERQNCRAGPGAAMVPGWFDIERSESVMSGRTAVVIPYYQEQPGILRPAVISAMAQEGVPHLEIIVVDDGAPAPARQELAGLVVPPHITLSLIEQRNRGPGAARNRALDSVSPDTAYVAFLDSDDRWTNNHIRNARSILDQGYDLYFADLWFPTYNDNFFHRQGMLLDQHQCLDRTRRLYRFVGNARFDLVSSRNVFHTSTVVYRYGMCRELRFPEISFMGEDLTFWMELVSRTSKIAFCHEIECLSDEGVHIYENHGWDSPGAIWRLHQYIKWRKWLKTVLTSRSEIDENRRQIKNLRRAFALNLLHEVRNARAFRNADIFLFLKTDPIALLHLGPVAVQELFKRAGL
jgi:succinoglycan biosynthesis protein ExoW